MGIVNTGNQLITLAFFAPADSWRVNNRFVDVHPCGIYKGGYLSKVSDVQVTLSPLVCNIKDEISGTEYQVKVETSSNVTVTVSSSTPYIILRWEYVELVDRYMDILAVASSSIQANDLIVGKAVYSGATLQGFDYSERSNPDVFNLFLKVEPAVPASLKVRIRGGRTGYGSNNYDVIDQLSSLFTAPPVHPRIDLIYIDIDGAIKIATGVSEAGPVPPNYGSRVVLAEISLAPGQTTVTKQHIKDVRNFISGAASTFLNLTDTPSSYSGQGNKRISIKGDQSGIEFKDDKFTTLVDTPPSYVGYGGKMVEVKGNESGLEFSNISNHISILTGTIAHGGTIPLPSGYTQAQCKWTVSVNDGAYNRFATGGADILSSGTRCSVDANRFVSMSFYGWASWGNNYTPTANYIIIGVK